MDRRSDLIRFYDLLARLEQKLGGKRRLADCHGRMGWPERGVYFFFEPGEVRTDTGTGPRVVCVGTHAITDNSRTSLWHRLSQHRGSVTSGGGNHRGSIFRLLVGAAIKNRDGQTEPRSWGVKGHARAAAEKLGLPLSDIRHFEAPLESMVSMHIAAMPFLWLAVDGAAGPGIGRALIKQNCIALLSNYGKPPLDAASDGWLGRYSDRSRVRESGLWNNRHVDEGHDPTFLDELERCVE